MQSRQDKIASLIDQLSVEEKVRMMSGDLDFWPGFRALLNDDYYHKNPFPAARCERLGLAGLHFVDGPRGVVLFGGATTFPVSMARGASWDHELEERIGEAIGKELRALGGTLFGGVCINLVRHPAWGRAQETYGEDPVHVGAMGVALVRGVQRHAIACVKHLAANSMENARFEVNVTLEDRTLHEVYLPHFKDCIDAGARAVMSAYNAVNGHWCGENGTLLTDVLKKRWQFKGFVLTDFIFGMRDARKAIDAGLDLEMPLRMVWGDNLKDLVVREEVSEDRLDQSLHRLIDAQLGIPAKERYPQNLVGQREHRMLAREAAAKSIVLLKNDDDLLPLRNVQSIVVVGPLARIPNTGDRGSSDGRPNYVVTPLDGLREALGDNVQHFDDVTDAGARAAIRRADAVVIVAGYTHLHEGEHVAPPNLADFASAIPPPVTLSWIRRSNTLMAIWRRFMRSVLAWQRARMEKRLATEGSSFGIGGDRQNLSLPPEDIRRINTALDLNPKLLVGLMGGSAILMEEWRHKAQAIMMIWYPGMEGGHAFADIVLGNVNPSGKLPFVIPKSADDLPEFHIDASEVHYGYWHGHRLLHHHGAEAAFPFGFGLNYSRFDFSNFSVGCRSSGGDAKILISLDVTNRSDRDGEEVVQIYVHAVDSKVERPARELKAFKKVSVGAGRCQNVSIDLPLGRLGYFDVETDDFVVEPIAYEFFAAHHADDQNALSARIDLRSWSG